MELPSKLRNVQGQNLFTEATSARWRRVAVKRTGVICSLCSQEIPNGGHRWVLAIAGKTRISACPTCAGEAICPTCGARTIILENEAGEQRHMHLGNTRRRCPASRYLSQRINQIQYNLAILGLSCSTEEVRARVLRDEPWRAEEDNYARTTLGAGPPEGLADRAPKERSQPMDKVPFYVQTGAQETAGTYPFFAWRPIDVDSQGQPHPGVLCGQGASELEAIADLCRQLVEQQRQYEHERNEVLRGALVKRFGVETTGWHFDRWKGPEGTGSAGWWLSAGLHHVFLGAELPAALATLEQGELALGLLVLDPHGSLYPADDLCEQCGGLLEIDGEQGNRLFCPACAVEE